MKEKRTVYYKTEEDDFFHTKKKAPAIDGSYKYEKCALMRFVSFILYRLIAKPLAFLYTKLKFGERIIGKEKLSPYKKSGFFIYSNHTQPIADALTPNMLLYSKRVCVIVNKENLCLPVIGKSTALLGALPLPDSIDAVKNFQSTIKKNLDAGAAITVYPEAHVWPYYTGIRSFSETAFEFPLRYSSPVFVATRVYKKRRRSKKPRCEIYVDGPIFPDKNLKKQDSRRALSAEVFNTMSSRAALSDCEYIIYKKEE